MREEDWRVRTAAYRHLIDSFNAPQPEDLAETLDLPRSEVEASLRRLDAGHQIVLAPGEARIWMLHPFSAMPTEYPVRVGDGVYWGNCAWDAFGIPAVLGTDGSTKTRCAESGAAIEFGVRDGGLWLGERNGEARSPADGSSGGASAVPTVEAPGPVIHFAVPAAHWYDNIAFT